MDVSDPSSGRRLHLELRYAPQFAEYAVDVQRQGRHLQLVAHARPLLPGAIAVDLDPVAVRIGQVERLADQVIGRAIERPTDLDEARQREGEVRPGGHEDGQVVEARRAPVQAWRRTVAA